MSVFPERSWTGTIYDLYGPSLVIGGSAGAGLYVGMDMVYLGEVNVYDTKKQPDGFQITIGFGGGEDIHIMKTKTVSGGEGISVVFSAFYKVFRNKLYREKTDDTSYNSHQFYHLVQ